MHLSNLDNDPAERNNVAADYPQMVSELSDLVTKWYEYNKTKLF